MRIICKQQTHRCNDTTLHTFHTFLTSWYLFHEHRKQHIWHPTWKRLKAKSTKCEAFHPPHTRLSRYIFCLWILKLGASSWAFFIHVLSLRLRKALLLLNDQDGICVRYKYETAFGEVLQAAKLWADYIPDQILAIARRSCFHTSALTVQTSCQVTVEILYFQHGPEASFMLISPNPSGHLIQLPTSCPHNCVTFPQTAQMSSSAES